MPVLLLLLKTKGPRADHLRGALDVPLVDDKRDWPALDMDDEPAADVDVAPPGGQASGGMATISTTDSLSVVLGMTSIL